MADIKASDLISVDPEIVSGTPCFRGTRVHDLSQRHLAVVVVPTNRRKLLEAIADRIRTAVTKVSPRECLLVPLDATPEPSTPGA